MNRYTVTGNLTKDPQIKVLDLNGKKTNVVNVTVATSEYYTKANGEREEITTFIEAEAWDKTAETIAKNFVKGSRIYVEGPLRMESWVDKVTEQKRSRLKLRITGFEFFSVKKHNTEGDDSNHKDSSSVQDEPVAVGAGAESGANQPF